MRRRGGCSTSKQVEPENTCTCARARSCATVGRHARNLLVCVAHRRGVLGSTDLREQGRVAPSLVMDMWLPHVVSGTYN
jgi:hypothetical protein